MSNSLLNFLTKNIEEMLFSKKISPNFIMFYAYAFFSKSFFFVLNTSEERARALNGISG